MGIQIFKAKKAERQGKKREYHLSVSPKGRCTLTMKGKDLLGVLEEDGILQGQDGGSVFIAKRPIGVEGGFTVGKTKTGSLTFGGGSVLQLYTAGKYKLVSGTSEGGITWYKLEAFVEPVKPKTEATA